MIRERIFLGLLSIWRQKNGARKVAWVMRRCRTPKGNCLPRGRVLRLWGRIFLNPVGGDPLSALLGCMWMWNRPPVECARIVRMK